MQTILSRPSSVFLLFPNLRGFTESDALTQVGFLATHGSSGELCLAKLALELAYEQGALSEALWRLDEPNFNRLLLCLKTLRAEG
jgi:hypothetical protein